MTTETTTSRPARRVAALAAALFLVPIGLLTGACTSWTEHDAISTESTAPHPCVVGGEGCGPLPRVPTHGSGAYDAAAPTPRNGPLRAGRYGGGNDRTGIHISFTVPAGWRWNGRALSKGNAAISFYVSPVRGRNNIYASSVLVYNDPCHWDRPQHRTVRRALASVDPIIRKLAAQPMRYATHPIVSASSTAIRLTVPSNLAFSSCDHGQYRTWGTGANTLLARGPGQRDLIWAAELSWVPTELIVDVATFPSTPARLVSQVDAIIASVGACAACGDP